MDLSLALESNKSKKSVNKDFYQPLVFEKKSMAIPVSDVSNVINTYKVFDSEKDSSTKYRLNITLNPIMTNALTNKLSEITRKSDGAILTGDTRLNAIQTIDDNVYDYKLGYDIFDNNFMRIDTFKTGTTLNSFTGKDVYNVKTIESSIYNNIIEDNGWICLANKAKINGITMFKNIKPCEKIDLFPTRNHLLLKPIYCSTIGSTGGELRDNWEYILTYPYENYTDDILVTSIDNINGIPTTNASIINENEHRYLLITTVYKHGLKYNDVIKIKNSEIENNKSYLVYDVGDINRNNKEYTFILDADKYTDLSTYDGLDCRIVRVINNVESQYYIRKFRKLPNFSDEQDEITEDNINAKISEMSTTGSTFQIEAYQPGFSRNIFNDSIYQLQYIDDVDTNIIKDNLGRPLSEIYFTIIKKNIIDDASNEPSNLFTKVMSGIDEPTGVTNFHNVRLINGVNNTEYPLEDNICITGSTLDGTNQPNSFLGDIVEYNITTVKEVKLDDVKHRFNTIQREKKNDFVYSDIYGDSANLLLGTSFTDGLSNNRTNYWYPNHNPTLSIENSYGIGGTTKLLKIETHGSEINEGILSLDEVIYESGVNYIFSFYAKANEVLSLGLVGISNLKMAGFTLTTGWNRYTLQFVGDGLPHNAGFYIAGTTIGTFYLAGIKSEIDISGATNWGPNPIESSYSFINKTIHIDELIEGYYYKPHYKIQLKNYSSVISSGKLEKLTPCSDFVSGATIEGDILLLETSQEEEISSLCLKFESINGLSTFDNIRITRNSDNKFINAKIIILSSLNNVISFKYNTSFFPTLSELHSDDYTIRKYSDNSIPLYCQDTYDGNCLWRKTLKEGTFDDESIRKNEFEFTNGRFYVSESFNFYLKRQDPFGQYNMRREVFPADLFGDADETQILNNIIEKSNGIC